MSFNPKDLAKHFDNLELCKTELHMPRERIGYIVKSKTGGDAGTIAYLGQGEWRVFVDNFPSQKKYFSTNLPIKSVQEFADDMARTGLDLIPAGVEKP